LSPRQRRGGGGQDLARVVHIFHFLVLRREGRREGGREGGGKEG